MDYPGVCNIRSQSCCPSSSAVVDFLVPGLDRHHFIAWGTPNGLIEVGYYHAPQSDQETSQSSTKTPLCHILTLEFPFDDSEHPSAVTHLAYGGGPHALLAATSTTSLAVFSLESLLFHILLSDSNAMTAGSDGHSIHALDLCHQETYMVGRVDSSSSGFLALSWTRQLDGILTSNQSGELIMWQLKPLLSTHQFNNNNNNNTAIAMSIDNQQAETPSASAKLRRFWTAHAPEPQDCLSAGVTIDSPSASACSTGEKNANIWWPDTDALSGGGGIEAKREKLKHPAQIQWIEWSPGVLEKDIFNTGGETTTATTTTTTTAITNENEDGEDTQSESAMNDIEDHPALMTLGTDGVVRLWVEMLVVQHIPVHPPPSSSSPSSSSQTATTTGGSTTDVQPTTLHNHIPTVESYFAMSLVIDAPPEFTSCSALSTPNDNNNNNDNNNKESRKQSKMVARWTKSPGSILTQSRGSSPSDAVLWIITAVLPDDPFTSQALHLHVYAVRGLSAVIVASFPGRMSGTSTLNTGNKRPQAILWGQIVIQTRCVHTFTPPSHDHHEINRGGDSIPLLPVETKLLLPTKSTTTEIDSIVDVYDPISTFSSWLRAENDDFPQITCFYASTRRYHSSKSSLELSSKEMHHSFPLYLHAMGVSFATVLVDNNNPTSPTSLVKSLRATSNWHASTYIPCNDIISLDTARTTMIRGSLSVTLDTVGYLAIWSDSTCSSTGNSSSMRLDVVCSTKIPTSLFPAHNTSDSCTNTNNTANNNMNVYVKWLPGSFASTQSSASPKDSHTNNNTMKSDIKAEKHCILSHSLLVVTPQHILIYSIRAKTALFDDYSIMLASIVDYTTTTTTTNNNNNNSNAVSATRLIDVHVYEKKEKERTLIDSLATAMISIIVENACDKGEYSMILLSITSTLDNNNNIDCQVLSTLPFMVPPSLSTSPLIPGIITAITAIPQHQLPSSTHTTNNNNNEVDSSFIYTYGYLMGTSTGQFYALLIDNSMRQATLIEFVPPAVSSNTASVFGLDIDCESGLVVAITSQIPLSPSTTRGMNEYSSYSSNTRSRLIAWHFMLPTLLSATDSPTPLPRIATQQIQYCMNIKIESANSISIIPGMIVRCVCIGTTSGRIAFYAETRKSAGWQCVAVTPSEQVGSGGAVRALPLLVSMPSSSSPSSLFFGGVLALSGSKLSYIFDEIVAEKKETTLSRLLLDVAGPLPQYHPNVLRALLKSRQYSAVRAILTSLVEWLPRYQQSYYEYQNQDLATTPRENIPMAIPSSHFNTVPHTVPPSFPGIELGLFLDQKLESLPLQLKKCIENLREDFSMDKTMQVEQPSGITSTTTTTIPTTNNNNHDNGMLDLAAFGMDMMPTPTTTNNNNNNHDSGMLDLAAFGMDNMMNIPNTTTTSHTTRASPPFTITPAPSTTHHSNNNNNNNNTISIKNRNVPQVEKVDMSSIGNCLPQDIAASLENILCVEYIVDQNNNDNNNNDADADENDDWKEKATHHSTRTHSSTTKNIPLGGIFQAYPTKPLPSLSLEETRDVFALALLFSKNSGFDYPTQDERLSHADTAAAQYMTSLSLACMNRLSSSRKKERQSFMYGNESQVDGSYYYYDDEYDDESEYEYERSKGSVLHMRSASVSSIASSSSSSSSMSMLYGSLAGPSSSSLSLVSTTTTTTTKRKGIIQTKVSGSMKNAAGVEYTVVPSMIRVASISSQQSKRKGEQEEERGDEEEEEEEWGNKSSYLNTAQSRAGDDGRKLASSTTMSPPIKTWGLMPGMDLSTLVWSVLSQDQDAMLFHGLERYNAYQRACRAYREVSQGMMRRRGGSFEQEEEEKEEEDDGMASKKSNILLEPVKNTLQQNPKEDGSEPTTMITWRALKALGAGFWLTDPDIIKNIAETLSKQQFAATRKADDVALLYAALGKKSVLQGLYRSTQHARQAEFLSRDFRVAKHKEAACKNAFVLMGQHRYELAAAFFLLGDKVWDAVCVCAQNLHDIQYALFISRLVESTDGTATAHNLIQRFILSHAIPSSPTQHHHTTNSNNNNDDNEYKEKEQRDENSIWIKILSYSMTGQFTECISSLLSLPMKTLNMTMDESIDNIAQVMPLLYFITQQSKQHAPPMPPLPLSSSISSSSISSSISAYLHDWNQLKQAFEKRCIDASEKSLKAGIPCISLQFEMMLHRISAIAAAESNNDQGNDDGKEEERKKNRDKEQEMRLISVIAACLMPHPISNYGNTISTMTPAAASKEGSTHTNNKNNDDDKLCRQIDALKQRGLFLTSSSSVLKRIHSSLAPLSSSPFAYAAGNRLHHQSSIASSVSLSMLSSTSGGGSDTKFGSLLRQRSLDARSTQSVSSGSLTRRVSLDGHMMKGTNNQLINNTTNNNNSTLSGGISITNTKRDAHSTTPSSGPLGDGTIIFHVDGDAVHAVCCCPLIAPDVFSRPVIVATQKHGLLEFALSDVSASTNTDSAHAVHATIHKESKNSLDVYDAHDDDEIGESPPLSPSNQGIFSRFLSQIFDQTSWMHDPLERSHQHHHHSADDGDVGLAIMSAMASHSETTSGHNNNNNNTTSFFSMTTTTTTTTTTTMTSLGHIPAMPFSQQPSLSAGMISPLLASSKHQSNLTSPQNTSTYALAAHPTRQLFVSGCETTGKIHLWQFGGPRPLAAFTPVSPTDLSATREDDYGMFSFSTRFSRAASLTARLGNWGRAKALTFTPNGERFAAVSEGGVVAVWRAGGVGVGPGASSTGGGGSRRQMQTADADGSLCAEWWHHCLTKEGCAVTHVGGGGSVLAVGGSCPRGNISLWDTASPANEACVGRLTHHAAPVTTLCTLPGGWLLAAGDRSGGLSLSDIRMLGGISGGVRTLWSVRAVAKGHAVNALVPISIGNGSGHHHQHHHHQRRPRALALGAASGGGAALITGGGDGAVRVWSARSGALLQSISDSSSSNNNGSNAGSSTAAKGRRLSIGGGNASAGVTGLAVCEEGVVSCCSDGTVKLFPFV